VAARALLTVKENIAVEGQPFECGSATRTGVIASSTASSVSAALASGFAFASMAECDEFAYGCTGELNARGPLTNPIAPGRLVGGSSSGCAVAVASGTADAAIGTDTAGSVRIPAALCGIVGFKPAFDSIARDGVFPLSKSLDHVGVLGRSLEVVARLADALITPAPLHRAPESHASGDSRLLIARPSNLEAEAMDDLVRASWRHVSAALELPPVGRLPGWTEAQLGGATVQAYEALQVHRATVTTQSERIHPDVLARLDAATTITTRDYRRALHELRRCREHAPDQLGEVDIVALPTVPVEPPRRGHPTVALEQRNIPVRRALLRNTRFANYSGLPALSIPVWVNDAPYPIGVQLIGRTNATVLAAGAQVVARLEASGLRTSANSPSVSQDRPAPRATPPVS
jgi:aspartyl-tRNA(Asn)/glutamyl-tRNA(Gln) amidotransferase subunit A